MAAAASKRKPPSFPTDVQLKRALDVLASKGVAVTKAQVFRDRIDLETTAGRQTVASNPWDKPA